MRISDWSSDVCSSDLVDAVAVHNEQRFCRIRGHLRLDDLAIRNTDRAWHMARCVLIGPAEIDHDDARLSSSHRIVDVGGIDFNGELSLEVLEGNRGGCCR